MSASNGANLGRDRAHQLTFPLPSICSPNARCPIQLHWNHSFSVHWCGTPWGSELVPTHLHCSLSTPHLLLLEPILISADLISIHSWTGVFILLSLQICSFVDVHFIRIDLVRSHGSVRRWLGHRVQSDCILLRSSSHEEEYC